jgi:hypothetical protein
MKREPRNDNTKFRPRNQERLAKGKQQSLAIASKHALQDENEMEKRKRRSDWFGCNRSL